MKRLSILLASLVSAAAANAQCSPALNNYEVKLTQTGDQTLKVQVRYHANAVAGAESILPVAAFKMDGMIFAITWPKTSNGVKLTKCTPANGAIDIILDNSTPSGAQNKVTSPDNIQTLLHNNIESMPKELGTDWKADQWYDLATLSYTGKLATGDYFSLMNCDYGLAHPNSYYGNTTTDPWLAMFDAAGNYVQYSPKMITELPTGFSTNVEMYPIPTSGLLNIDVEVTAATNAVVKVMDNTGRLVKTVLFDLDRGKNQNTIDIGELPAGNYMVQLTDGKALNFSKQISKN